MIICQAHHITKSFGGNVIFEDIMFEVVAGDRIGIVGRNGSGKTTLFQLLTGSESADAGTIHFKKGTRVGYLSQIPNVPNGMVVQEVLETAFQEVKELEKRMRELEERMSVEIDQIETLVVEYGTVQERYQYMGGYETGAQIEKISRGLGMHHLLMHEFATLSGGEKTKVCLGLALLQNPDILLLDEPTNHLDIHAVEWLEQFLREYRGTVLVISHDRYFLDAIVTKIVDMEDGALHVYHANYSQFVQQKQERLLQEFQAYEEQQKKIKKMQEAIKRLKKWANEANPPSESLHRRARNMERALERMEKVKRPILERKTMGLQLQQGERSGKDVLQMKEVSKAYGGRVLFEHVHFHLQFQDRVAIVGENGTGKTTLLQLLLGNIQPDSGEVRVGSSVKIGYLAQSIVRDEHVTVLKAFREKVAVTEGEARHILARFLFYGFSVFKRVGQLSGGERMRLRLAQLMYEDCNVLILDEPTNHLDIESREVLEEALEEYTGTILAVSHDRYFLNKIFTETCWIVEGRLQHFVGNYTWARQKLLEAKPVRVVREEKPKIVAEIKQPSISSLEKELLLLEQQQQELQQRMATEENWHELTRLQEQLRELEAQQLAIYERLE